MTRRRGDGAVVSSAPIVRRAVDYVVRRLASQSNFKELFFHETHSFADIVLNGVVLRLREQDEGAEVTDTVGVVIYDALHDAMIKIGWEPPAILTQAVVERAVAAVLEDDERFPHTAFSDRALQEGSHKGEFLIKTIAYHLRHTDGGEQLEEEFGVEIRKVVWSRNIRLAAEIAHKEVSALKRPRKASIFMAMAERPQLEKDGMSPGEIGARRRPGAVFTRDDAFPQASVLASYGRP
jgi:hypothetical protein